MKNAMVIFVSTILATLSGASVAQTGAAECEPLRRAIDDAERACEAKWNTPIDIHDCKEEQVRAAEARFRECIRAVNVHLGH